MRTENLNQTFQSGQLINPDLLASEPHFWGKCHNVEEAWFLPPKDQTPQRTRKQWWQWQRAENSSWPRPSSPALLYKKLSLTCASGKEREALTVRCAVSVRLGLVPYHLGDLKGRTYCL